MLPRLSRCLSALVLAIDVFLPCAAQQPRPQPEHHQQSEVGEYDYGPNILLPRGQLDTFAPILTGTLGRAVAPSPGTPPNGKNDSFGVVPPPRKEVRQLRADPYAWNLYLLGLSMIQFTNQSDVDSWYQISGIHGIPFGPWNDVMPLAGSENSGYCPHTSVLFPTWHRPYLALFEQILYDRVNRIAGWFQNTTEERAYRAAAVNFRLPYWDFAISPPEGESVFLAEFTTPAINVYGPAGWQTISNPLYSYNFNPVDPSQFIHRGFNVWTETKRAPASNAADALSRNNLVVEALDQALPTLQQRLYTILSNYPRFTAFSNKRWGEYENQTIGSYDSCESLHDSIHMMVGQHGHFEYIDYSAFDPIFWLHHATVDRLVALWQIVYPNTWVEPVPSDEATFTTAKGQIQDATTLLTPFRTDAEGGFWDSNAVRDLTAFGYSYEDLYLNVGNATERRRRVIAAVNSQYGGSSPGGLLSAANVAARSSSGRDVASVMALADWENEPNFSSRLVVPPPLADVLVRNGSYTEWLANMHVNDGFFGGSFSIHLFVGRVPADTDKFASARNLVGTMSVFAMASRPGMVHSNKVSSTVPLTAALLRLVSAQRLGGLDSDEVVPFLQRHLKYRIVDRSGKVVDATSELNLSIAIASANVEAPLSDSDLPRWGSLETKFVLEGSTAR